LTCHATSLRDPHRYVPRHKEQGDFYTVWNRNQCRLGNQTDIAMRIA